MKPLKKRIGRIGANHNKRRRRSACIRFAPEFYGQHVVVIGMMEYRKMMIELNGCKRRLARIGGIAKCQK